MLTSGKHLLERKGLPEENCSREPSEDRGDERQHSRIRQGKVLEGEI